MRDKKIEELIFKFSEEFKLSSFFNISVSNYEDVDYLGIKALGDYTHEFDLYLIEKGFSHLYREDCGWDEYSKDSARIVLMNREE